MMNINYGALILSSKTDDLQVPQLTEAPQLYWKRTSDFLKDISCEQIIMNFKIKH